MVRGEAQFVIDLYRQYFSTLFKRVHDLLSGAQQLESVYTRSPPGGDYRRQIEQIVALAISLPNDFKH